MATKDYCLPDKSSICIGETLNGQYSNLNLNHNHQGLHTDTVNSKSTTNDSTKVEKDYVKKDLKSRTCDDCGKYFATKKGKLSHRKSQVCTTADDYLLESESEEEASDEVMEEEGEDNSGGLPIIDSSTDVYAYVNVFENHRI
uniref:C2H2-type domain-containing protein n=1 Tax=Panagrolaimus sp. ES5 TaxID=591445 RepID=A0AC34G561_9BILA